MKRGAIILFLIVIFLTMIIIIRIYLNQSNEVSIQTDCAKAGEVSRNPSLGPDFREKSCCEGLVEISGDLIYRPDDGNADENGCLRIFGGATICSNCGNAICESDNRESPCSCPSDCT